MFTTSSPLVSRFPKDVGTSTSHNLWITTSCYSERALHLGVNRFVRSFVRSFVLGLKILDRGVKSEKIGRV
jgi:hypothetical protein